MHATEKSGAEKIAVKEIDKAGIKTDNKNQRQALAKFNLKQEVFLLASLSISIHIKLSY